MVIKEELVLEFFNRIEEKVSKEKIYKRELEINILKDKAISIIGPRRAGKTYYLYYLKKNFGGIYIDFESVEFLRIETVEALRLIPLYENYFNTKAKNIFLDEVQNLKNWESLVRTLLSHGFNVFLSGSSSKLLSRELSTKLRGRTISYILLPLSFREYLIFKGFVIKNFLSLSEIENIKKSLREYLEYGGFPEVVLKEEREKILKEYLDLAFFKDFVERHKIKSIEVARIIFDYLIQNFSKEISVTKIQNFIENTLGIRTRTTIYSYLDKMLDTSFMFFIEKYSKGFYERKKSPKKVYLCDIGLTKVFRFSEDIGRRLENIVFLELLRKTNQSPLLEVYYFKDYQQREVDFLVKEGAKIKQLIQVTYASSKDEIDQREIKSLEKAYELFKSHRPELIIITWDYEDVIKYNNLEIKCIPLWKWLLILGG